MSTAWPEPSPPIQEFIDALRGVERTGINQWSALCPNPDHDDSNPSFGFREGDQKPVIASCLGCDDWPGIKEGLEALGLPVGNVGQATRRPVRQRPSQKADIPIPPELEDQVQPLYWHDALMSGKYPDQLEYLMVQRGLTVDTIEFAKIGYDSQRYTFPVRYKGKLRNVRRYLPGAKQNKMLNIPGHGTVVFYMTETLAANNLPVLICEGEVDSLLARQHSEGRFVAISGTGGAGKVPNDLSLLVGREVFIAYDLDDAGMKGALKMRAALIANGTTAHILDLRKLGLS